MSLLSKSQIEELLAKATKGPWQAVRRSVRVLGSDDKWGAPNGYSGGICNTLGAGYGGSKDDPVNVQACNNANFIASAPDLAETALAALAKVEELEKKHWCKNCGGYILHGFRVTKVCECKK